MELKASKFLSAHRIDPDGTPRSAAPNLGLHSLPMSHTKEARLNELPGVLYSCIYHTSKCKDT